MRLSLLSRRTTATQALSSSAGKSSVMSTDHKQQAKRLRTSLAERGVEVTHSEALELVAHQYGARDWNTLAAAHAEVAPPRAGGFGPVIPVLRIFDVDKAREFYTDFLGFSIDWEHTFDDHAPVYLQASRGGAVLHLSEHHGDASPGATARVIVDDVHGLHAELHQRDYRYAKPGLEQMPWGREVTVLDPFANRIVFHQPAEDADAEHPDGGGEAAGPIEHEYDVACTPEHAFAVFTVEIGTWWPDGYSPPGKQDVVDRARGRGRLHDAAGRRVGVPLGHRHRVGAAATSAWTSPSRRTRTTRAGSTCGSTPTARAPGCASATAAGRPGTWPAGRGSASGRSSWTGSSRGRRAGRLLTDGELTLRRAVPEDAPDIAEVYNEADTRHWMLWDRDLPDLDEALANIERSEQAWADGWGGVFRVVVDDHVVGGVNLHFVETAVGELSYFLRASARGRGLATRAVLLAADWGFREHDLMHWMLWEPEHVDEAEALANIARSEESWADGSWAPFRVVVDGHVVGGVNLHFLEYDTAELSYFLRASARGRGLATRAVLLATDYGFRERGTQRVFARVDPANAGSVAVAQRAGFTFEGIERHSAAYPAGRRFDSRVYSLLPARAGGDQAGHRGRRRLPHRRGDGGHRGPGPLPRRPRPGGVPRRLP